MLLYFALCVVNSQFNAARRQQEQAAADLAAQQIVAGQRAEFEHWLDTLEQNDAR